MEEGSIENDNNNCQNGRKNALVAFRIRNNLFLLEHLQRLPSTITYTTSNKAEASGLQPRLNPGNKSGLHALLEMKQGHAIALH